MASRSRRNRPDPGWLALQRERYGPAFRAQPKKNLHQAGDLVDRVLKGYGLENVSRLSEIEAVWEDIAGKANAAHARPGRWERGIFTVYVDHHVWLAEMKRFAGAAIEKRLRERLGAGAVKQVRFEMDPGTSS